jgi:hypothetical protein
MNQTGTPCAPVLFQAGTPSVPVLFYEHDHFGKSVASFPDHALSSAELGAN